MEITTKQGLVNLIEPAEMSPFNNLAHYIYSQSKELHNQRFKAYRKGLKSPLHNQRTN